MRTPTLLEQLPDENRIVLLLRADGWGYDEIAMLLGITNRRVRFLLEQSAKAFPAVLGHRRDDGAGRINRLIYLSGYCDGRGEGMTTEELQGALDSLPERCRWLLARIANREQLERQLRKRPGGEPDTDE